MLHTLGQIIVILGGTLIASIVLAMCYYVYLKTRYLEPTPEQMSKMWKDEP